MKAILKKTLHNFGYDLVRMNLSTILKGDFWSEWFYHFPSELTESYIANRKSLKRVPQWLEASTYNDSHWGYGVPEKFFSNKYKYSLNHNPNEFTYSDLMVAIGRRLGSVNFLEIGVSAGKNFYQLYTALENSKLYGMDIEEINPVLASPLSGKQLVWKSERPHNFTNRNGETVKKTYTLHEFQYNQNKNTVYYLSGDKFNHILWDGLDGIRFNIIFSDAFHKPESIKSEYEVLKQRDLIDLDNFLMIWDDLEGVEMQKAFLSICEELTIGIFNQKKTFFKLYNLHGTYGGLHTIGLFCSFQHPELSKFLDQ